MATSGGGRDRAPDTALDERSAADSAARSSPRTRLHAVDETNSYIQVVVQKQRRGARLPAASSPARAPLCTAGNDNLRRAEAETEAGVGEAALLRPSLLLLPPLALAALSPAAPRRALHPSMERAHYVPVTATSLKHIREELGHEESAGAGGAGDALRPPPAARAQRKAAWRIFDLNFEHFDTSDYGPERVEVFYFESAEVSHLARAGGARRGAVQRGARGAARAAAALLDELLAAARLPLAAPLALLLAVQRCALETACGALRGALQAAADEALKPALALLYNALLQPPLVFAANTARGVRAALRPIFETLGDALEPLARVLAAVRLVHVHVERVPTPCTCRVPPQDSNV